MSAVAVVALFALAVLAWPGHGPAPWRVGEPATTTTARPRRARRPSRRGGGRSQDDGAALAELFAAALDAGLAPQEATRWCVRRAPAPDAQAPDGVAGQGGYGAPAEDEPEDAVRWWQARVPAVARALAVAERVGAPAASAVRSAADGVRTRHEAEEDLRSRLAGVRATAWLLTALPAGGLVLVASTVPAGPGAVSPLTAGSVVLGCVLTVAGWWTLGRLVAVARRRALS